MSPTLYKVRRTWDKASPQKVGALVKLFASMRERKQSQGSSEECVFIYTAYLNSATEAFF